MRGDDTTSCTSSKSSHKDESRHSRVIPELDCNSTSNRKLELYPWCQVMSVNLEENRLEGLDSAVHDYEAL